MTPDPLADAAPASLPSAPDAPAVLRAAFNPLLRPYLVIYVAWFLLVTVVLSPLAVLWLLGVGQWWARHYFDQLKCELDDRVLNFRKGILFQVEKTIPLENIEALSANTARAAYWSPLSARLISTAAVLI